METTKRNVHMGGYVLEGLYMHVLADLGGLYFSLPAGYQGSLSHLLFFVYCLIYLICCLAYIQAA